MSGASTVLIRSQCRERSVMSRSIHKTVAGVFRGKSVREVQEMVTNDDPDVVELRKKHELKEEERRQRALAGHPTDAEPEA